MKLQFFCMFFNFSAFKEIFKNWFVGYFVGFFFLVKWEVVKVVNDQKVEQNNDI